MKLNVGDHNFKGIYRDPEWTNIDIEQDPKHRSNFIKMSVLEMPEAWTNKFDEIHMVHCLEHINRNERQNVLNALYRVTAPGGIVYVEVPDFLLIIHQLANAFDKGDDRMIHLMTTSIYGKQRYPGDQHCWGYTVNTLTDLFQVAGFKNIAIMLARPNKPHTAMISDHYKQEPVMLAQGVK